MVCYVDDVFFATADSLNSDAFFKDWPADFNIKKYQIAESLYATQIYKNGKIKHQIFNELVPNILHKKTGVSKIGDKCLLFAIVRESITDSLSKFDYVTKDDQNFLINYLYFTSLVHPTPIDLSFSARVIYKNETKTDNDLEMVIPNTDLGNGCHFIVGPEECYRNYLTPDELQKSYTLFKKYNSVKDDLPKKINVVTHYYLSSFWSFYFEISLVLIVIALEMLFIPKNTRGIKRQFKQLIPIVSKELANIGFMSKPIDEIQAEEIYKLRCKYVHRGEFYKNRDEFRDQYLKFFPYLESAREILSGTIRRCIEDINYANGFKDPKDIDKILLI